MNNDELNHPVSFDDTLAITPYFFVYGTLKRGQGNHCVAPAKGFVTPAVSVDARFKMTCVGFPYLFDTGEAHVVGEVYRVTTRDELRSLDSLEGYPHHYTRKVYQFFGDDGNTYDAWVYINDDDSRYESYRRHIEPVNNCLDWTSPYREAV